MGIEDLIFYFFIALTVIPAFMVVLTQSLVRAAFSLLLTLVGVAGLYVMVGADFLAVSQLMIYVGGILVLILFAIMFTRRMDDIGFRQWGSRRLVAAIVLGGFSFVTFLPILAHEWVQQPGTREHTVARIGDLFLGKYLLPFEIISILLLAALAGAVMIVRKETKE